MKMKKILGLILAFSVMISAIPQTFAEGEEQVADIVEAELSLEQETAEASPEAVPTEVSEVQEKISESAPSVIPIVEEAEAENSEAANLLSESPLSSDASGISSPEPEELQNTAEPEILLYRDYEDYTGGADVFNISGKYTYGTANLYANSAFHKATEKITGVDGIGAYFNTSGKTTASTWAKINLPKTYDSGKMYLAFNIAAKSDAELEAQDGNNTTKHGNYLYWRESSSSQRYLYFYTQHSAQSGVGSWHGSGFTSRPIIHDTVAKIEIIIDLDADKAYYYYDGAVKQTIEYTVALKDLQLYMTNGVGYFDNLALVYYPADVTPQTFSVASGEADTRLDALRVSLKSDAYDSDAKYRTDEYSAPYGISLAEECIGTEAFTVMNSLGEAVTVTEVTKGDRNGEYVIKVDADIKANEKYTVIANSELADILGATVNAALNGIEITATADLTGEVIKSGDSAVVKFADDIINPGVYKEGAKVRNVMTGEEAAVTLTKSSENSASIGGYTFEAGYEYVITVPELIRGRKGNTIYNPDIRFNLGTEAYLKKLILVDVQGKKHDLQDVNMAGLDSLSFEFSDDITDAKALLEEALTIIDKDGNEVAFTVAGDGSTASAVLSKILTGDNQYTVSLISDELSIEYAIPLKTDAAGVRQLPVIWLDADGNELLSIDDISAGDTVQVRIDYINSGTESASFLSQACLYNGRVLTGFDFEEVNLASTLEGSGRHTSTFSFVADDISKGLKIKAYMWESLTRLLPVISESVFE